jgi:peptidoglycan/LPS O-acetylase OafA/YrhL
LRTGFYEHATPTTYVVRLIVSPIAAVLAVVLVTDAVTTQHLSRIFTHRFLLFFGAISYALYLWHGILDHVLGAEFGSRGVRGLATGSTAALIAIVLAVLSYRFVERPFLLLKRRFERNDAPAGTSVAAPAQVRQT